MLPKSRDILAIDFGTTNTYLATGNPETGKVDPVNVVVQARQMGRGLATAVLYSGDREVSALGDRAVNWFYTASEENRREYRFRLASHFKPDIVGDATARQDAVSFLKAVLDLCQKNHLQLEPEKMDVFFGIPCQAGDEYKQTLRGIAKEAGYGNVSLLEEPYGALFYHEGDNSIKDILRSCVLVIDFGGGTCDFTLLKEGKIVGGNGWGDMNLGGRLFDDLFYQWYLEQNPQQAERIREQHLEFFVRTQLCREVKEEFSVDMVADRNRIPFPREVGRFGMISGMTLEEFEKRARHYTPGSSMLEQFQGMKTGNLSARLEQGNIDLFQWFMETMESGFRRTNVGTDQVDIILLAGGSSAWYFVSDCCEQLFGTEKAQNKMRLSRNVFAAIAEGMVKYRFLCDRASSQRERLKRDLPDFAFRLAEKITKELTMKKDFRDEAGQLFESNVAPVLLQFGQKGGTVGTLREELKTAVSEREFSSAVMRRVEKNIESLLPMMEQEIDDWFRRHGVDPDKIQTERIEVGGLSPDNLGGGLVDLSGFSFVAVTIGSCIVANILGGGGVALLMGGPIGLVIGFVLGFVLLNTVSEQLLEKVPVHRWLTSRWLTKRKIETDMKDSFVKTFEKTVSDAYEKEHNNIVAVWQKKLIEVVEKEIQYLEQIDLIQK